MKTRIQHLRKKGFIQRIIPVVLIAVIFSVSFHSCQKDESILNVDSEVDINQSGQLKSATISTDDIDDMIQEIDALILKIENYVTTGDLEHGIANSLISKLENAKKSLENGNEIPAMNQLQAVINELEDLIDTGAIDAAIGEELIYDVKVITGEIEVLTLLQQWNYSDRPDNHYISITYDGNVLWATEFYSGFIISIELDNDLSVQSKIPNPTSGFKPWAITWDGNNLWTVDRLANRIYKHSNDNMLSVLEEYPLECEDPYTLGWDGNNLWCTSLIFWEGPVYGFDEQMHRLNSDGTVLNTYEFEGFNDAITDIAWDGSSFWAVTWLGDKIYKCGIVDNKFVPNREYEVFHSYRIGIEWVDDFLYVVNLNYWQNNSPGGMDKYALQ
jgi:hypothetical protein